MYKLIFALLVGAATSSAASLTLNLDTVSLSALPGETLFFSGSITSTFLATVDLNAINLNLGGDFLVDSSPFFLGPLTVSAGGTTVNFTLFQVTVNDPFTVPYGLYTGTISLLGGVEVNDVYDPNILDPLGDATFSIEVQDPSTAVPEPAFGPMVLAVTAGLVAYRRRQTGVW